MVCLPPGALLLVSLLTTNAPPPRPDSVLLHSDLGAYHLAISTKVPLAQRYFDQGMRLMYAFAHGEAVRAFKEAARLDPTCAICHWGAALAYGPHVNAAMDSAAGVAAWAQMEQAIALESKASSRERAYIEALRARYAAAPPKDRSPLDSAYAKAMAALVRRYPKDLDAATMYAESLMDLRPWNYWTKDGAPYPGTEILVAQLQRVIKRNPNHPGACHYYIHAVEAVDPERAVPCAERLAALMPGEQHMIHMPGHIYVRVGRYADAIHANVHAVHAEETYIAAEREAGMHWIGYYPHNLHFLAFVAALAGNSTQAIDAAHTLVSKVDPAIAHETPLESLLPYLHLTLITFGKWDDVLSLPTPPSNLRLSTGLTDYARGVAFAATGKLADAEAMLDSVKRIAAGTTPPDQVAMSGCAGENRTVMQIARHALMGEIAQRRGQLDDAVTHFREAAKLEDSFNYTEPPQWYFPVRHALGAALLQAGRSAEAEVVYREDLKRFPENGWALYGLAHALRDRGALAEAAAVEKRLAVAWGDADVHLTASRF